VASRHRIVPIADHIRFGAFLRQIRTEAGVSQRELALLLRLPQSFISKIESGERQVQVLEFLLLCEKLKVDASVVLARYAASTQA